MIPAWTALIACVVVLVSAAFDAQEERKRVFPASIALALNWIWFQSAFWGQFKPAQLIFDAFKTSVDPIELWGAGDAITAIYVFTKAHDRMWGISLVALYIVQIVLHATYEVGIFDYPLYNGWLDFTFIVEVACLFAGSNGCGQASNIIRCLSYRLNFGGVLRMGDTHQSPYAVDNTQ